VARRIHNSPNRRAKPSWVGFEVVPAALFAVNGVALINTRFNNHVSTFLSHTAGAARFSVEFAPQEERACRVVRGDDVLHLCCPDERETTHPGQYKSPSPIFLSGQASSSSDTEIVVHRRSSTHPQSDLLSMDGLPW